MRIRFWNKEIRRFCAERMRPSKVRGRADLRNGREPARVRDKKPARKISGPVFAELNSVPDRRSAPPKRQRLCAAQSPPDDGAARPGELQKRCDVASPQMLRSASFEKRRGKEATFRICTLSECGWILEKFIVNAPFRHAERCSVFPQQLASFASMGGA